MLQHSFSGAQNTGTRGGGGSANKDFHGGVWIFFVTAHQETLKCFCFSKASQNVQENRKLENETCSTGNFNNMNIVMLAGILDWPH